MNSKSTLSFPRVLPIALLIASLNTFSLRATVLFQDDFLTGWTVVQPQGEYFGGALRWEYDLTNAAIAEQSNVYTDDALNSPSAIAPMLINDTVTGASFTYTARLTAGDDDGFGLIFGFQDEENFYRVTFSRQATAGRALGYPWIGTTVDRKTNSATVTLFGPPNSFTNTANRPFDVSIAVDAFNRLTLKVVDNPLVTPVTKVLVNSQPLPTAAYGKVGVFTWGMSGGTPPGFRIQNLNLSPLALTGSLNSTTNWTAVIPPRAVGSGTTQNGAPNWVVTARDNGPTGMMEEMGDCFQGNDAAGLVDFTGPTLVAGSDTWSNYVVAARIIPFDDDAQGLVLRYRNPSNFYRIVLRSQVSAIGPQPGLSIQKNVNRVYTEVYHDSPAKYSPVAGVPYDLVAQMNGNTLSVLLVADPESAAQVYRYGPFTATGVDTGKVGLVSWAMSRTDFGCISVQDGASLYVSSPFGTPSPGRGLASHAPGTVVNAFVGPATVTPGTRRAATGWIGAGSVPASGVGTNVSFTLNTFSELHWQWQTEYRLSVTNNPGGTVSFPPGDWFLQGATVTVVAQPNTGFAFAGWTGDSLSTSPTLNLTMSQPYTLTANFIAERDGDGLPDAWELAYFGDLSATPDEDPDGDGRSNLEEYENGTNPRVADILRIEKLQLAGDAGTLTVSNNTGTRYDVARAITLPGNWATIGALQFGSSYTSALPASDKAFWRLSQPARPVDVPPFVAGSWTLAVLPDTQIYSESYPELFKDQTRWIVANKDRYNIEYVLHLGDIVNVPTALNQWTNAKAAISLLDGQIPHALATGNHDHGTSSVASDRTTVLNNYFPVSNYLSWPTFGGTCRPIGSKTAIIYSAPTEWIGSSFRWSGDRATRPSVGRTKSSQIIRIGRRY